MVPGAAEDDPLSRWLTGEGQKTLDLITGGSLDVVGVVDSNLRIRSVNWTVPGLTREAIIGKSVLDLVPPGYKDVSRDNYSEVLRTGNGTRFETIYKDGEQFLVWDVRVGPIRFEAKIIGLIAITSNVTEQRREHADRDRFFSLSLDLLVVASPAGYFKRVNPAFGETLGYDLHELTSVPFVSLVHPDDRARTSEVFEDIKRGTPVFDFENRYRHKEDGYRVFSWRATVDPVTGDVYAVARDITA